MSSFQLLLLLNMAVADFYQGYLVAIVVFVGD